MDLKIYRKSIWIFILCDFHLSTGVYVKYTLFVMQIKRNDGPGSPDKPRVYVNSIFEIQENATVLPSNKVRRGLPVLLFRTDTDRVADPHHLDADPDPALHFYADPDTDFNLNTNPDPAPLQCDRNLRPLVYRPYILQSSIFEPPGLHCERPRPSTALFCKLLKLLNFDFNADSDLAFHSNADSAPSSKNNADPDPQH
jgi:hypothetical protein